MEGRHCIYNLSTHSVFHRRSFPKPSKAKEEESKRLAKEAGHFQFLESHKKQQNMNKTCSKIVFVCNALQRESGIISPYKTRNTDLYWLYHGDHDGDHGEHDEVFFGQCPPFFERQIFVDAFDNPTVPIFINHSLLNHGFRKLFDIGGTG